MDRVVLVFSPQCACVSVCACACLCVCVCTSFTEGVFKIQCVAHHVLFDLLFFETSPRNL